uniref:RNA-directed DNA polymerase, eukaryota n=1 Tax=Tanacetum cinerariifolium TaxID=118510 RepID=A0A6L2M3H9_TANCI|nr:RNA-directed DNA polymerase, eukaryota [Tanacetum cinerariifolium]
MDLCHYEVLSLLNTPADQHLRIVGFNLEGVVVEWFQWMTSNDLITTWARFEESVKTHFGQSKYEDPNRALSKLLQLGTRELLVSKPTTLCDMFLLVRTIKACFDDQAALVAGTLARVEANKVVNDGDDSGSSGPMTPTSDSESLGKENYDLLCSKVTDLVLPNISDRLCWSLKGSQEFLVISSRILIDNTILPKAKVPTRWLMVVPIKVNVHAWRVCLNKLPIRANLSLRGMDISSIACPLCNSAVESSSHIFLLVPWLAKFGEKKLFGGILKAWLLTPTTSGLTGLSIFVYISN